MRIDFRFPAPIRGTLIDADAINFFECFILVCLNHGFPLTGVLTKLRRLKNLGVLNVLRLGFGRRELISRKSDCK